MLKKYLRKTKKLFKSLILDITYWQLTRKILPTSFKRPDSLLILPAADGWEGEKPHGFGDEMLMLGYLEGLNERFAGNIYALSIHGQGGFNVHFHGHSVKMLGFHKEWVSSSSYEEFANIISTFTHFTVIGADVLDGAYGANNSIQRLRFLNIAAKMGVKTAITGCSFNGTKDSRIRRLLITAEKSGTVINARDRVSFNRLRLFLKNTKEVADLAFLVNAEKYAVADRIATIRNRAENWKKTNGSTIGINLCGWHIKDKDIFFDRFISALSQMQDSQKNIAIILLPHDTRTDRWSDLDTLEEFRSRLGSRIEIIGTPQEIKSGIDAKQVVSCCDVLLTGRMHLAIAAHDQGVPAVSFGYQGKFEGFYGLYGMGNEWLVDYANPENAIMVLQSALEQRKELSEVILRRKDEIRAASASGIVLRLGRQ